MMNKVKPFGAVRGAALVVALLIVAMVVMLATALASDFLLLFRRVENQLYSEQAYAYLQGAEELARAALLQDMEADKSAQPATDNLAEEWAQEQQFPTDYGWIAGRIEDLGGRFNVNALATAAGGQPGQPGQANAAQNQFIRLLLALPLQEPLTLDQAQALAESVTDWIDKDSNVSGLGGAESQYYAQAEPAGRPGNTPLASPSELMWVKGMTPQIYRALAPLITVWPDSGSPVNLNTAAPAVLRCIGAAAEVQPLNDAEVDYIMQTREAKKFFADTQVLSEGILAGRSINPNDYAVVGANYFLLHSTTEFQGHRYSMQSLLHRMQNPARVIVIARTYGDW